MGSVKTPVPSKPSDSPTGAPQLTLGGDTRKSISEFGPCAAMYQTRSKLEAADDRVWRAAIAAPAVDDQAAAAAAGTTAAAAASSCRRSLPAGAGNAAAARTASERAPGAARTPRALLAARGETHHCRHYPDDPHRDESTRGAGHRRTGASFRRVEAPPPLSPLRGPGIPEAPTAELTTDVSGRNLRRRLLGGSRDPEASRRIFPGSDCRSGLWLLGRRVAGPTRQIRSARPTIQRRAGRAREDACRVREDPEASFGPHGSAQAHGRRHGPAQQGARADRHREGPARGEHRGSSTRRSASTKRAPSSSSGSSSASSCSAIDSRS